MEIITEVKHHITAAIVKDAKTATLNDDCPLIEQGVIDSLGILSLLEFIEREFSIQISVDELTPENFETPLTISRLIERKLNGHAEV